MSSLKKERNQRKKEEAMLPLFTFWNSLDVSILTPPRWLLKFLLSLTGFLDFC